MLGLEGRWPAPLARIAHTDDDRSRVTHHACDESTLHDLLRTPRMKEHMAPCERRLARFGLTLEGLKRSASEEKRNAQPSDYVLSQFNRERLYNQVWSEPTRNVAASYGISDVWLSKICRQLKVPKPPRGYWAKKAAGQSVPRRPKLPGLVGETRTNR